MVDAYEIFMNAVSNIIITFTKLISVFNTVVFTLTGTDGNEYPITIFGLTTFGVLIAVLIFGIIKFFM